MAVGELVKVVKRYKLSVNKVNKSWDITYNTITLTLLYDIFDSKSLQMVIAAMNLKDAYSLEGKLGPT